MKRIIALSLALLFGLFSVCGGSFGEEAGQTTGLASQIDGADASVSKAFERALSSGFVPEEWKETLNEPASYADFMQLLDQAVGQCDAGRLSEWQARYPEARQLEDAIDWTNASIAIFAAAETLGDLVYCSQLPYPETDFELSEAKGFWGDMERKPIGFDNADENTGWDYESAANNYLLMRVSMWDFTTIYPDPTYDMEDYTIVLSRRDAILACFWFYESTLYITERAPTEEDEQLLASAEARKQAILNSVTDVTYSGTARYVSNDGDDASDGLSPETAWATLAKVNDAGQDGTLRPGDAVFFERGDLWRGTPLLCAPGVTYSAYGEGENRVFTVRRRITPARRSGPFGTTRGA